MKIENVRTDPETGHAVVIVTGVGADQLSGGDRLRCAAYRLRVIEKVRDYPEAAEPTAALLVTGGDSPKRGMVVHPIDEKLTAEELAIAVRHLLMVPRMLKGIDAALVLRRIVDRSSTPEGLATLQSIAKVVLEATDQLPRDADLDHADRYVDDLLHALT